MKQLKPLVQNMIPGLAECGKIKIGKKGAMKQSQNGKRFQMPEKLNHFLITTLERDNTGNYIRDEAIHKKYGDAPTTLDVMLMFNSIEGNFRSCYQCMNNAQVYCRGDGERAYREGKEISCPCEKLSDDYTGKDKCKWNGVLSCIITGSESIGGVYKFRTTGKNSCVAIQSSLMFIQSLTGGILAGLPLKLVFTMKDTIIPTTQKPTKIPIVRLEYAGSITQLQQNVLEMSENEKAFHQRLEHVEKEQQPLLDFDEEDPTEINEEFYPEQYIDEDIETKERPKTTNLPNVNKTQTENPKLKQTITEDDDEIFF